MVKLDKFAIEFSNIEGAYFAGQEVSGKVIIENKEPKKVSEILLELKGRARTYWTKHSGQSRKHCSSAEPYFCEQFNTCYTHKFSRASLDIKEGRILPEGYHEIPFSYILPKNLPTSFEGEFGFIRYTCKATCERPWDFDIVCKKAFSVIGIEDINEDPKVLQPAKVSECNSFARFCCRNQGSILAEMHLERTGFTPGESFCLNIAVRNDSYKTLKACIKFVQTVNYKAKTFAGGEYVRSVDKVVIKKDISEINARKSFNWNERTIVIPSVPPALGTCKIISIYYSLQLQVANVITSVPIRIGTIPLLPSIIERAENDRLNRHSAQTDNNHQEKMDLKSINKETIRNKQMASNSKDIEPTLLSSCYNSNRKKMRMPSSIISDLYPMLPNPYYRESHFGEVDIMKGKENIQFGDRKFAPKYPFYYE